MSRSGARLHQVLLAGGLLAVAAVASRAMRNSPMVAVDRRQSDSPSAHAVQSSMGSKSLINSVTPVGSSPAAKFPVVSGQGEADPQRKFSVTIRKPVGPPRVDLGILDAAGKPITVACSTCHTTRPANFANHTSSDLDEFHQNLAIAHGKVTCLSCHNPDDYDTLRLADGRSVEYAEVMTLCGQCHGPKTRDYQHGAHGGMNGYWDLSRGPRTRNNCVDCHNPHAPSFPAMRPTFKPRDRFLSGPRDIENGSAGESQHE